MPDEKELVQCSVCEYYIYVQSAIISKDNKYICKQCDLDSRNNLRRHVYGDIMSV